MGKATQLEKPLPTPDSFRVWLQSALKVLKVSAYTLAVDLGLGRNTIAAFLSSDGGDIRLGTARKLHTELAARAANTGATLPALGGIIDG